MPYYTIRFIIRIILAAYEFLIFIRVLLSWITMDARNPFYNFVVAVTEPFLAPIRKLLDKSAVNRSLPFDFSPVILLLIIELIRSIIF